MDTEPVLRREPEPQRLVRDQRKKPSKYTVEHVRNAFDATCKHATGLVEPWAKVDYSDKTTLPHIDNSDDFSRIPAIENVSSVAWLHSFADNSILYVSFQQSGMESQVRSDSQMSDAHAAIDAVEHAIAHSTTQPKRSFRYPAIFVAFMAPATIASIGIIYALDMLSEARGNLVPMLPLYALFTALGAIVGIVAKRYSDRHKQWLFYSDSHISRLERPEAVALLVGAATIASSAIIALAT